MLEFLSAMRIFGFGNVNKHKLPDILLGFYPQCGFLALGTPARWWRVWILVEVSIRNADFWLWEPGRQAQDVVYSTRRFYPQCGFLALGTAALA